MGSRRERGFSVTPERLAIIEQKMHEIGIESREALAKAANLSSDVIKKLFLGKTVDRSTIEAVSEALKIEPTEIIEIDRWYRRSKAAKAQDCGSIDWRKVCRDVLELQQKQWLTSHPLGAANRRVQDVYIPLGLVERQSKPRVKQDFEPENWSVQEQEEKIVPVSHQEFFGSTLKGQSPKSKGKRIAIVGEPGAGKTTLLQEIGAKVDGVAIWIDLASLKRDDTLEDYLLRKWLKPSLGVIRRYAPAAVPDLLEPSVELKQAFTELFEQNQVWLLLDGADEMASELGQPLSWVAQQLRQPGWVAQARAVLTSRLNVWSADGDRLVEFDTYRNLDFEPEQVYEFIDKWFAEEPNSSQKLKEDLERSSDRIRSLIRNPLRLTLLCITWKGVGDRLPETKAGLYQRLVNAHYKWKDDKQEFVIDPDEREQLHQQLGELSKAALDSKESRFRLRQSFIARFLGKPNKKNSLFWWAIKLGWLNQIGLPGADENDADEPVYAFFHPTFQEYFAALAIEDWDFFLPREHRDKPVEGKEYRIFEPQWKEVILLWLGRPKERLEDQKRQLIQELVEFKDGCNNYYEIQAHFLATAGISEFKERTLADSVITKTVKLCLGYFDYQRQEWLIEYYPVPALAKIALLETERSNAANIVAEQIVPDSINNLHPSKDTAQNAAKLLGLIGKNNPKAIDALIDLISNESQTFNWVRLEASKSLVEIGKGNERAIRQLRKLLSELQNEEICMLAAGTLGKISPSDPYALNFLTERMHNSDDEEDRLNAACCTLSFDNTNPMAINTLHDLSYSKNSNIAKTASILLKEGPVIKSQPRGVDDYHPEEIRIATECLNNTTSLLELLDEDKPELARKWGISKIFEQSRVNYSVTVKALTEHLKVCRDEWSLQLAIEILGEIAVGDENVVRSLLEFLRNSSFLTEATPRSLTKILKGAEQDELCALTVDSLKNYLDKQSFKFNFRCWQIYEIVWLCARKMKYLDFYRAWHSSSFVDAELLRDDGEIKP